MCQKFIMPAMQSASSSLKMAALKAASDVAKALQKCEDEFSLVHHQDLIHEAIECMKAKSWSLNEKHVALLTTLELVKLPPFVSQLTRYVFLHTVKARFYIKFNAMMTNKKICAKSMNGVLMAFDFNVVVFIAVVVVVAAAVVVNVVVV